MKEKIIEALADPHTRRILLKVAGILAIVVIKFVASDIIEPMGDEKPEGDEEF